MVNYIRTLAKTSRLMPIANANCRLKKNLRVRLVSRQSALAIGNVKRTVPRIPRMSFPRRLRQHSKNLHFKARWYARRHQRIGITKAAERKTFSHCAHVRRENSAHQDLARRTNSVVPSVKTGQRERSQQCIVRRFRLSSHRLPIDAE